MQLRHPPVAGSLVQPVNVLAYEVEGGEPPLQLPERLMASVGFGKLHKFAAPLVPFPDESGVGGESLGGRELLEIKSLLEAGLGSRNVGPPLSAEAPEPESAAPRSTPRSAFRRSDGSSGTGDVQPATARSNSFAPSATGTERSSPEDIFLTLQVPRASSSSPITTA